MIQKNKKNALAELYYNLYLEVLSDEYEQSSTYDVLSKLFAEVSSRLQEAMRSNKLKREEDGNKNEEIKKVLYDFKPKTSNFEKTEQEIIQSILDQEDFVLKKQTMTILIHNLKTRNKFSKNSIKIIRILFKQF